MNVRIEQKESWILKKSDFERIFTPGTVLYFALLISLAFFIPKVINKFHAYSSKPDPVLQSDAQFLYNPKKIQKIVIDAGHGGKDPGCIGAGNIFEKNIALDIALKFGKFIEDSIPGVEVIYTRKTDKFVELYQRAAIANKNNADVFISVHCNANPSSKFNGFETYIMGTHKTEANLQVSKRENESILLEDNYNHNSEYGGFDPNSPESDIIFSLYQNAFMDQSARLASKFHESVEQHSELHIKKVKQAGFLVLWKTAMPSVLVETGFLTSPIDLNILKTEQGRRNLALSMMIGFRNYQNWYSNQ